MLWQEILNTVGLISNIVGVIYAFKYGFPLNLSAYCELPRTQRR